MKFDPTRATLGGTNYSPYLLHCRSGAGKSQAHTPSPGARAAPVEACSESICLGINTTDTALKQDYFAVPFPGSSTVVGLQSHSEVILPTIEQQVFVTP